MAQLFLPQRLEDHRLVQAVQELGPEEVVELFLGEVRGEQHQGVAEVHRAALSVGEAAVVQELQEHVEDVGVGLLHFVEEQHRVRAAPDRFRQLSAVLEAHVSRRRAQEAAHGVLLHVLAHVDAHQGVFAVKKRLSQGFAKFCLAHAGGTQE